MAKGFELRGIEELQGKLKKNMSLKDVKKVVQLNTAEMGRKALGNMNYTRGYSRGYTRQSMQVKVQSAGMVGLVGLGMNYDPYLETGTRFMSAEPSVKPAFNYQKIAFIKDLQQLMR